MVHKKDNHGVLTINLMVVEKIEDADAEAKVGEIIAALTNPKVRCIVSLWKRRGSRRKRGLKMKRKEND